MVREEGKRIYGDTMTVLGRDKRILVVKQPVGVVAASRRGISSTR